MNKGLLISKEVVDAFHKLISICPHCEDLLFSDYLLQYYIKNHCQFPPSIWDYIISSNQRFLLYFLKII
jgi:hypothetical protein